MRVLFISILITLIPVCAVGQNARKFYKAGTELVENKKYDDAVIQFTNAIGMEPSNPDYYIARARVYVLIMKYNEAKSDYEKAIVFDAKNVEAIISLGSVCNKMGSYEEALKQLNHATAVERRNARVYPEKVITLIGLERYDQALKVSDSAIMVKDTPMDYYYRGIIYRKLNNDQMAKKELEKAISRDKDLAAPRLALADLLVSSDAKASMVQCNEVLKNDDRNTDAYLMRSKVYMKMLDYPSAINDISKNILIDPENPAYYFHRESVTRNSASIPMQ
ncbi:MAG: hypothetical protein IPJ37_07295 [Bacteroidales bacterium]|nr:hypothetical protein [Bacteroidales bacterium]